MAFFILTRFVQCRILTCVRRDYGIPGKYVEVAESVFV